MLKLYYAPMSRSTRIVALIDELGADVAIETVAIRRQGGAGGVDSANPHPEGKVPLLEHDGALIWESPAIVLYLTDLFPKAGLGPLSGDPLRGPYLSWLAYYGDVMEPVMILDHLHIEHPALHATFRGVPELTARLAAALADRPYLLGDRYSAADLLLHSPYAWFRDAIPEKPAIRDWVARCMARPSAQRATECDTAAMAAA